MNKAILLMAYGTPKDLEGVEAYYANIRGGRKPSADELNHLIERYRLIGGTSPLIKITEAQRDGLQNKLHASGSRTKVYSGMKHSEPFLEDVVKSIAESGVNELLCIALAPHYSNMSVGSYIRIVEEAKRKSAAEMNVRFIRSWHTNPLLIQAWCDRINEVTEKDGNDPFVVFSAHSLPQRILRENDPYRDQLIETATLIAKQANISKWMFTFQSASHTGEPWLGPDILDALQEKYDEGIRNFVVAPIGFVSDHLEILYDIDVECKGWAEKTRAKLVRTRSLNASNDFIECLYSIVSDAGFI
ncbi:MAG: ferrochelatase [Nitrososphaerota archaeon]|jgi:ferrochelatase|nr:ferrochelatase [Nitrososphaerota archaeon]